ncbi:ATP-binding domain-containing protein [Pigmentiphaga litoralis]|uniref:ATP-binding domain-containing protein n=1 Tax=Pigmentiphaga litoralis TaxID=516702 RepID=UPI003B4321DF
MARMFPSDTSSDPRARADGGLRRELDVLERLELALSNDYSIFHSIDWVSVHAGHETRGEIDIIVMNAGGDLLILEVKAGQVEEADDSLYKRYPTARKDIAAQCRKHYTALRGRLKQADLGTHVRQLLVLPDHRMVGQGSAALPRERIIDADQIDDLHRHIAVLMPAGFPTERADHVRSFLLNEFKVARSLGVFRNQLAQASHRLASGLATWVPRLYTPNGLFWIQATAGSGKTQLALRLLEDAAAAGRQALYVCFNRPLSNEVRRLAPASAMVATFHELARTYCAGIGAVGTELDSQDEFNRNAERYVADASTFTALYDVLVIDEGQDFHPEWITCLRRLIRVSGTTHVLEDTDQRLYRTQPIALPDATRLTCTDNFRSPRAVVDTINAFGLADHTVVGVSPYLGDTPDFIACATPSEKEVAVVNCIDRYLADGYSRNDIVVLSYVGLARSALFQSESLGSYPLHQPGTPVNDDAISCDSIYRFKGCSSPVVILTDVDFSSVTTTDRRKLFVGLTRATMAAALVMTPAAADALTAVLDA